MDAADLDLLRKTVASAISADASSADNDAALAAIGWADMLAAEPSDAIAVVFGQLGRAAARSSLLDDVVGAALGLDAGVVVAHPRWGDLGPTTEEGDGALTVTLGARFTGAETVNLIAGGELMSVPASSVRLDERGEAGLLSAATVDLASATVVPIPAEATADATIAARAAIAHQLQGLAAGMLELARAHATERIQFGRPIGTFQAVRHKLAETHVAVEAAGDALGAMQLNDARSVDLTRVVAGRAAIDAGRHCQQVLAGIGFTRDHDFHRYLFTAIEIDGLYGTTAALTTELGRRLVADGAVPRVINL